MICEPTRGRNILDLLLVNDPLIISDVALDVPFCTSDHESFVFKIYLHYESLSSNIVPNVPRFARSKADWFSLSIYCFSFDWRYIFNQCSNANAVWESFVNALMPDIELFVPFLSGTRRNARSHSARTRNLI